MKKYDLIVLGTGNAGYQVAIKCKEAGWSVAAINDGLFGGTCAVRGCIPKKLLSGTAEIMDTNRRLTGLKILEQPPSADWAELIRFKRTFTDPVPPETEEALKAAGIDVYAGSPRFTGNLQIEINGTQLAAKKIHIAVGAKPALLPIDGFEHLSTSDDFLELAALPERIVFVGGGYISFELAHIAARFGAKVTILHGDDHPLPMFDRDIIRTLLAASEAAGITVQMNARVQKIAKTSQDFKVTTADGKTYNADLAVHGAGRVPAIGNLNLEATEVAYDKHRGIRVDDHLRSTTNPHIYAAGDAAAAGPPLSPVARVQGSIVADNVLGKRRKQPSYHSTPSVIFTTPAVAKVGYLEHEAAAKNIAFRTINTDLTGWFDAKRQGLKHARSKILVHKNTDKIIGAHLIGSHAEDVINVFSLAIEHGLTAKQLTVPIFAFPTATDDMRSMF